MGETVDNGTVHRVAANDVDYRIRAARGSVCNGLSCGHFVLLRVNHRLHLSGDIASREIDTLPTVGP